MQGIEFIPNQPIVFEDSLDECNRSLAQCYCQKFQPGDYLKFQFKQQPCGNDLICDGNFEDDSQNAGEVIDNACWLGDGNAGYYGWLVGTPGAACHTPGSADDLTAVSPPFSVGEYYKLTFIISGVTAGVLTVSAGDKVFEYDTNGTKTIYFEADTTALIFSADTDWDGCITGVESYMLSNTIDIVLANLDGNLIANLVPFVDYKNEFITVVAKIDDITEQGSGDPLAYGKYQVIITDPCNENELTSNCIEYAAEHECTKLIEAYCGCEAYGFDFSGSFTLVQRIRLIKFNSRYPAKQEIFISSAGDKRRIYSERNKFKVVKTDYIDEPAHDALSLQLICDVLTFDGVKYFYSESEFKPKWDADGEFNLATAQFEIEKHLGAVIYNTNCGNCDTDVVFRHRCVLFGWAVNGSYYKEIHQFQGPWDVGADIEFTIQYALVNGVDVLGYSPQLTLTQPSSGVYVPDLVIDDVHNDNAYVGYGTTPNTIVQNVTDWVNGLINNATLLNQ